MSHGNKGNPYAKGNPSWKAPRVGAGRWVNNAITQVPDAPKPTSWWLESKTRQEFNAKAKGEQRRMAVSKFGGVSRLSGD